MISVIIPTVQKKMGVLKTLVAILEQDNSVDEIIVINNKPEKPILIFSSKIKTYTPQTNLYVNGSWNLGVKLCKNENFVLMNDDLLIPQNLCEQVVNSKVFKRKTTGLIGVSENYINQFKNVDMIESPINTSEKIDFIPLNRFLGTGDWGIAIFGKKQNYYEIPDDLKIIYGDNYLLWQNVLNKKRNYAITNLEFNHIHSSSSASSEFSSIIVSDIRNSKKYFAKNKVIKQTVKKTSVANKKNYEIDYREKCCQITVFGKFNTNIFLVHKKNNELLSSKIMLDNLEFLAPKLKKNVAQKIVEEIIAQNKSC